MKESNTYDQIVERRTIRLISSQEEPDFYLIVRRFIFPLRKSLLNGSSYFKQLSLQKGSTHVLTQCANVKALIFVLDSMHGKQKCFPRTNELLDILDVANILGYQIIEQHLVADISNHFDDFGFFLLLKVADKIKSDWLLNKLCKEILILNFQQLNFNKVDLFQYDRKSFISILRKHCKLQQSKVIIGLPDDNIQSIIKQYSQINKFSIYKRQVQQFEKKDVEFAELVEMIKFEQQGKLNQVRKRSKTSGDQLAKEIENLKNKSSFQTNDSSHKYLKQEMSNLMTINSLLKKRSEGFMNQIKEIRGHICQNPEDQSNESFEQMKSSEIRVAQMERTWEQMGVRYSMIWDNFKAKITQNFQAPKTKRIQQEQPQTPVTPLLDVSLELSPIRISKFSKNFSKINFKKI